MVDVIAIGLALIAGLLLASLFFYFSILETLRDIEEILAQIEAGAAQSAQDRLDTLDPATRAKIKR